MALIVTTYSLQYKIVRRPKQKKGEGRKKENHQNLFLQKFVKLYVTSSVSV